MRSAGRTRLLVFFLVLVGVIVYVAATDGEYAQLARSFLRRLLRTLF